MPPVPRPSKRKKRVIAFIKNFGENLGLPTSVDEVGNVIIKTSNRRNGKPSNRGFTISPRHGLSEKYDVDFDFDTQGIEMYVDGDWVKTKEPL